MNTRSILFRLMLFPLVGTVALPAPAQTATSSASTQGASKPSASHQQSAADAAARRQLAAYLADFQTHPTDAALRDQIVALAKSMNTPPPIPQSAETDYAQTTAQLRVATTPDAFKAAAKLYEQVAVQAPWFADADYSAATAYAQGGDFEGALRNLALYQAAVRPGIDPHNAQQFARDLEHQQADQQFQLALQQFKANHTDASRQQVIRLALAMDPPPDIPEEARAYYVRAVVLGDAAVDNPSYQKGVIDDYKAALLIAPWWGEAYRKLSSIQKAAGQYDDAIATLNLYLLLQPSDARETQDEIYRLSALAQIAADTEAKMQMEEEQRKEEQQKIIEEQKKKQMADAQGANGTVEGRWYEIPSAGDYFVGGLDKPQCDYFVSQKSGRWTIKNSCGRPGWVIDKIAVHARVLSFKLSVRDPGFAFSTVAVNFGLSADGKTLEGQETIYDKGFVPLDNHPVQWIRRDE